jgi:arsenate reductase
MKTVVFACVHNAGRSQMAAPLFNANARANVRAVSAGTNPAERVHPEVVTVMGELGIDLSQAQPQRLTEELARDAWLLVTLGCGDECPYVPGLERADWPLEDPKGRGLDEVRRIRDEVKARVRQLQREKGWGADVRIEPISATDVPAAVTLLREYQRAVGGDLCFKTFDEELASLPGEYAPPAGALLLARADAKVMGCVAVKRLRDGVCEMKRLYVRPAVASAGIGRTLATRAIETARRAGYRLMELETLPTMPNAQALYRSLGFEQTSSAPSLRFELRL